MIDSSQAEDIKVPVMYSIYIPTKSQPPTELWTLLRNWSKKRISYDLLTGFTAGGRRSKKQRWARQARREAWLSRNWWNDSTYLGYTGRNGQSGKVDLEKYYTIDTERSGDFKLLEDVFFILVPEKKT